MKESSNVNHNTRNYTLVGIFFGFTFPVIATLFDILLQELPLNFSSVIRVQVMNPLLWIIDTAPIFLGIFSAYAGYKADQIENINNELERKIEKRTQKLEENNMVLLEEIDSRKNTEKNLIQARVDAEAAARAKSQFLSTMSHEIRTPLNAIIGMSGLLVETDLSDEQKDFVNTISKSGDNLIGIINNILDYAKIESGNLELEEIEFSVAQVVEDILDLVSATNTDKEIELIYQISERTPDYFMGDTPRIQQVLVNLVKNALKFTEQGEVVISVDYKKTDSDDEFLIFSIRDTGIGIPDDKQDDLFKSFSQVDASTTRRFGGTGLGLAISKKLVELMGGSISVESKVGSGSTFSFTLQCPSTEREFSLGTKGVLKDKKVFIVDDNATNRYILRRQCEDGGMTVTELSNPGEVIKNVKELTQYDFGIIDMQMPEFSGLDVARAVRKMYSKSEMPLVLLSSIMNLGEKETRENFNLYLTKPVKQTLLLHNLERVFSDTDNAHHSKEKEHAENYEFKNGLKILVAEDNLINQKVTQKMLSRLGLECDLAGNGKEAVEMCNLIGYDLVLMDMEMPVMDGIDATITLNNIKEDLPKYPVIIAMTANAMGEDKKRCLDAGMKDFLSKPVRLGELGDKLSEWFIQ